MLISDIDDSLERLGLEHIDLYYLHRDDPRVPVADVLGTLNREIQRGRVRALGASNWSVARIAEANAYAAQNGLHGFVVSQNAGSLATPNWKIGMEPTMRYNTDEETAWHTASQLPMIPYSARPTVISPGLRTAMAVTTIQPIGNVGSAPANLPPNWVARPPRWHWHGCSISPIP